MSIILNVLLLFIVFTVYSKLNSSKELAANEIQHQLIYLETTIAEQMSAGWTDPEIVSRQLEQSLETMHRSGDLVNTSSNIAGKHDNKTITAALSKLKVYKKSDGNDSGKDNASDVTHFEELHSVLRKNGFGQGIQITVNDFDAFIVKMDGLYKSMINPLESENR
ncbi:hypothetical protein [Sporosarcina sp.]|uniref:hypothetical protein n=1 Tax=Sporosarcina sp. TaxID=49982 RepID=UPI0026112A54|nr:hypothetical protein [Sporosarcina sp.]